MKDHKTPNQRWRRQPLALLFAVGAGDSLLPGFADAQRPAAAAQLTVSCVIEHHEKNDPKNIVCYLHRFCVWQPERADECLATISGTHASADLAGSRS